MKSAVLEEGLRFHGIARHTNCRKVRPDTEHVRPPVVLLVLYIHEWATFLQHLHLVRNNYLQPCL